MQMTSAETILETALQSLDRRDWPSDVADTDTLWAALDTLPAPIYVTDKHGVVVYFNRPCIDFAGRRPVPGKDRWCVTWKLYTNDGQFMPHDQCPMAVAIMEQRSVRGMMAVAERPDGTRVHFMPYPTPLFDKNGEFQGAVNLLIDISDERQASLMRAQADRCRRLAQGINDDAVQVALTRLALDYDAKADVMDELRKK
ncbi:MAG TPA: PAS domain-containing protein [Rhizomicrobium sp.]|nr:PAS domain-containing protein [Rhizomicrobium sp.]